MATGVNTALPFSIVAAEQKKLFAALPIQSCINQRRLCFVVGGLEWPRAGPLAEMIGLGAPSDCVVYNRLNPVLFFSFFSNRNDESPIADRVTAEGDILSSETISNSLSLAEFSV